MPAPAPPEDSPKPKAHGVANPTVEAAARVLAEMSAANAPPPEEAVTAKPSWRERAKSASQSIKGAAARAATAAKAAAESRREYAPVDTAPPAGEESSGGATMAAAEGGGGGLRASLRGLGKRREAQETHWDIMHRLQREEAKVRADASIAEVQAMVHTFTEAAEQLEVMGEPDKARDVMEVRRAS